MSKMHGDILRSYSTAAIAPGAYLPRNYNNDWLSRPSFREPLKLKLSLISDVYPRSNLRQDTFYGRSYPSVWCRDLDPEPKSGLVDQNDPAYPTPKYSTPAMSPAYMRNRVKSEPPPKKAPGHLLKAPSHFSKLEKASDFTKIHSFSPLHSKRDRYEPLNTKGPFLRDQLCVSSSPGRDDMDDDELDEVFASIVRCALSNSSLSSPKETKTGTRNYNPSTYRSFSSTDGNGGFVTQATPLYATRHSQRPPSSYCQPTKCRRENEQPAVANTGAKEFVRYQLEKVSIDDELKKFIDDTLQNSPSTNRVRNDSSLARSCQPFYDHSQTNNGINVEKRRKIIGEVGKGSKVEKNDFNKSNGNLQKLRNEDYIDLDLRNLNRNDFERENRSNFEKNRSKFQENRSDLFSNGTSVDDENFASGVSNYYNLEGFTTTINKNKNSFDDPVSAGKLRMAKSESSLRMASKQDFLLSDKEIYQVEMMNSGLSASRVYVCQCLANLYFDDGETSSNGDVASKRANSTWRRIATGVPVLILESEQCNNVTNNRYQNKDTRRIRRLLIRLSELGNGFKLWEDVIDAHSGYNVDRTFHTLSISADHRRRAGLSFDSNSAALQFYQHVIEFLDSMNSSGNGDNGKRCNQKGPWNAFKRSNNGFDGQPNQRHSQSQSRSLNWSSMGVQNDGGPIRKADISMPCCFKHVTSLKAGDALPCAILVTSGPTSGAATLTRINRSASIKSKHQPNDLDDDISNNVEHFRPKRAQSCTQILMDQSRKWENGDVNDLSAYDLIENTQANGDYGIAGNSNSTRLYAYSREPVT